MKTRRRGKTLVVKPIEIPKSHGNENEEDIARTPPSDSADDAFLNMNRTFCASPSPGRRGTDGIDISNSLQNSPSKRLKGISPPTGMNKAVDTKRLELLRKALNGYSDDVSNLFKIDTWKVLIKKAIAGTGEERKYKSDDRLTKLAEVIIEQITSPNYSGIVSQILATCRTRNNRNGANYSQKFLKLCEEYEHTKSNKTWKKAVGEDSLSGEEDTGGWVIDEGEKYNGPLLSTDELLRLNSSCESSDDEVEEKENATYKIQTRGGSKFQKSRMQFVPKQMNSKPVGKTTSQFNGRSGSGKGTGTNRTRHCSVSLEAVKENRGLPRYSPVDNLERCPHIDQFNENSASLSLKSVDNPVFQLTMHSEDEIIENETPPPTPLSESEVDPIPHKRTRYNSFSVKERSPAPPNKSSRSIRPQPIVKPIGSTDTSSLRSNRTIIGDTGMIDRYAAGFDYFASVDDGEDKEETKDSDSSLPALDPPEQSKEDKENQPISEQEILRDYPKPISCPDLKPFMFEEIGEALSRPKKDKIVSGFALTIRQEHLAVYNKSEWLEDVNIDFYLELIKDRNNRDGCAYPSVYIYHSYFYKLLEKRGYEAVQGATSKENIFEYHLVLIPIHVHHHWILIVVDFRHKSMTCYDSMDHNNDNQLKIVREYIHREWIRMRKEIEAAKSQESECDEESGDVTKPPLFLVSESEDFDEVWSDWSIRDLGAGDIAQQTNGRDCGVFCLQFAEYLSRDHPFDFEQRHTAYFRKRMLYETLKKNLLIA